MSTTTQLDVTNADALLVIAEQFAAAVPVAEQVWEVAVIAGDLPDSLAYGPAGRLLAVILKLAELSPEPQRLAGFTEQLPQLQVELLAQLTRNEHITADGLTGEITAHTAGSERDQMSRHPPETSGQSNAADELTSDTTTHVTDADQTPRTEAELDAPIEDDDVSADYAAQVAAEEAELAAYDTETCAHGVRRSGKEMCQDCEDELFDGEYLLYCSRCGMDQGTCRQTRGYCCTGCSHSSIIIREQAPAPAADADLGPQKRKAREEIAHALANTGGARTRDAGYELLYRAEHHCPGGFTHDDLIEIAHHLGLNPEPKLTPHQVRHQIIEATAGQRATADIRSNLAESHGFPDFATMLATVNALEENERNRYLRSKLTWAQYKLWPTS